MLYSCFNQSAGLYDYFQDDKTFPVNGDLPIPKHPPMAGKIGVPAIHAGRPLPSGAKPAGRGWHARGMVVQCGVGGGGGLGGTFIVGMPDTEAVAKLVAPALIGMAAAWLQSFVTGKRLPHSGLALPAVASFSAVAGFVGGYIPIKLFPPNVEEGTNQGLILYPYNHVAGWVGALIGGALSGYLSAIYLRGDKR